MTEEELNRQHERLNEEREYIEARKAVTSMRCPVCGHPLRGYVTEPKHDTLDITPHIVCTTGCKLIHYEGITMSLYGFQVLNGLGSGRLVRHVTRAYALSTASNMIRPWIKQFGSPLEQDY